MGGMLIRSMRQPSQHASNTYLHIYVDQQAPHPHVCRFVHICYERRLVGIGMHRSSCCGSSDDHLTPLYDDPRACLLPS